MVVRTTSMDWDKLRVFYAVAEAGSFTHACTSLNLSQSAISRQVSTLENSLKVPLFHRHARGLKLTEQGELLFTTVQDVFSKLSMTQARIGESKKRPQGPLKINTAVGFGSIWLTSRIKEFINRYPDIDVSLVLDDSDLDLSMREADVAIRLTRPTQPDLIQKHILTAQYSVFASPEYLETHGIPKSVSDLDAHSLIVYGDDAKLPVGDWKWLLEAGMPVGIKRKPILRVNSMYGIFRAVQNGLGIAGLPNYIGREIGGKRLVKILPELQGPKLDFYIVYPMEMRNSKRIAVLRDFLIEQMKLDRDK